MPARPCASFGWLLLPLSDICSLKETDWELLLAYSLMKGPVMSLVSDTSSANQPGNTVIRYFGYGHGMGHIVFFCYRHL